jgi:dihydroorotate dehydrogenase
VGGVAWARSPVIDSSTSVIVKLSFYLNEEDMHKLVRVLEKKVHNM